MQTVIRTAVVVVAHELGTMSRLPSHAKNGASFTKTLYRKLLEVVRGQLRLVERYDSEIAPANVIQIRTRVTSLDVID